MRTISFTKEALLHLEEWRQNDVTMLSKIILLLVEISKNPFAGIGKPEPLKHNLKGK